MHHKSLDGTKIIYYVDDGYSGTTFERPGFESMIEDIRKEKISCIIVKDLSRLGRNYIETGYYLEEVFPVIGVRFIAINDSYDTAEQIGANADLNIQFKNMVNDFYCKDISKKIRTTIKLKKENGDYMGGTLPYGYRKEKDVIITEQSASDIVKKIFQTYNSGKSAADIAKELNADGIDNPSFYMDKNEIRIPSVKNTYRQWNGSSVLRILRNETYTGVLLYHKTESLDITMNIIKKYGKDEWLRIEGIIPPMISKEEFELAASRKRKRSKNKSLYHYPKKYVGKIRCGYCNHNLTWRLGKKEQEIYYCRHYNFTQHDCNYIKITEQEIDTILKNALKMQIAVSIECNKMREQVQKIYLEKQRETEKKLKTIKRNYIKYAEGYQSLYGTYAGGNIDRNTFQEKKEQLKKLKVTAAKEEEKLYDRKEKIVQRISCISKKMDVLEFAMQEDILQEEMGSLVKEIIYYGADSMEIRWNFKDGFRKILRGTVD